MVLGTLIALLLARLGAFMRLLLTTGLVLVWAMPVVVAVNIWIWMFDFEFGVVNYLLTELGVGDYVHHDWFENSLTRLRDHRGDRRLGRDPVRRHHRVRGPDAGAAGARRGRVARRRRADADLPRHHDAAPEAALRHPHEPVDHLGLPDLQPGVDRARRAARRGVLPDGDLRLRGVVPHPAVRPGLGNRGRDGRDHARPSPSSTSARWCGSERSSEHTGTGSPRPGRCEGGHRGAGAGAGPGAGGSCAASESTCSACSFSS